jgi:hypothetical protein
LSFFLSITQKDVTAAGLPATATNIHHLLITIGIIRIMVRTFFLVTPELKETTHPNRWITSSVAIVIVPSNENGIEAALLLAVAGLPVVAALKAAAAEEDRFVDPAEAPLTMEMVVLGEEEVVVVAVLLTSTETVKTEVDVALDLPSLWVWTLGHWWID